jgi:demethylmenaquinone methyltransferase/2-methoxy-6-polyprenyl-1,4-benzoquinol methylase
LTLDPQAQRIRAMFDGIAQPYDLLNAIFSAGRDGAWRRHAAELAAVPPGGSALDLCTGTGKLAGELRRRGAGEVVGLDFSTSMLARARRRFPSVQFQQGDALALPYPDARFDAVTMAFGIRNVVDRGQAVREMRRVLRPNGRAVILEFALPNHAAVRWAYQLYLHRLMPAVGSVFDGRQNSYRYLADTVARFPAPETFASEMRAAGFPGVTIARMTVGIVAFFVGQG